jgi:hypothetical protein
LTIAGLPRLEHAGEDANRHEHPAASIIADQVERRCRLATSASDRLQHASGGDVVDVVTGGSRIWTVLTPASAARVHETWIYSQARLWSDTESFGYSRSKSFDQGIGRLDQPKYHGRPPVRVQVHTHRQAVATKQEVRGLAALGRLRPIDAEHRGPEVSKEHPRKWTGTHRRNLDDPKAGQRAAADLTHDGICLLKLESGR